MTKLKCQIKLKIQITKRSTISKNELHSSAKQSFFHSSVEEEAALAFKHLDLCQLPEDVGLGRHLEISSLNPEFRLA